MSDHGECCTITICDRPVDHAKQDGKCDGCMCPVSSFPGSQCASWKLLAGAWSLTHQRVVSSIVYSAADNCGEWAIRPLRKRYSILNRPGAMAPVHLEYLGGHSTTCGTYLSPPVTSRYSNYLSIRQQMPIGNARFMQALDVPLAPLLPVPWPPSPAVRSKTCAQSLGANVAEIIISRFRPSRVKPRPWKRRVHQA